MPKLSPREVLVERYCELQPQMQRRFSALLHRDLRDELHAVTDHQLSVLTYLRGQSVTMRELAKELDVGESAATAVVDRLVRQGLVLRCDDPSDRRCRPLGAEQHGRVARDQVARGTPAGRRRISSCRSPTISSRSSSRPWRCSTLPPSRMKHSQRPLRTTTPRRSRQDDDHRQRHRRRPAQRPQSGRRPDSRTPQRERRTRSPQAEA